MVMSDDDYTIDQHDLLLMMAEHLIKTSADAIAPLRCDYGHCERSKGNVTLYRPRYSDNWYVEMFECKASYIPHQDFHVSAV